MTILDFKPPAAAPLNDPARAISAAFAAQTVRVARRYAAYCRVQRLPIDWPDFEIVTARLDDWMLDPGDYEQASLGVADALGL